MSVSTAAEVFKQHIHSMLPAGDGLSLMLDHLSGADCAAQLHACQGFPAVRGERPPWQALLLGCWLTQALSCLELAA